MNWFSFHCTIGCSIILTSIVNDMGSQSKHLYCTLYMFCIGLMIAVLAETCSPDVTDISSMRWCTYVVFRRWNTGFFQNDCQGFNNLSYTNTWDNSICIFLFNRTTLQVFVTYLTDALYVHPLWFYKNQHDNRIRSKLSVACQRWWFQWLFWFVPSVPGYLPEEEEHKPDPWRNPIERNHMGLHLDNDVVKTPTIISNNPV